jgi:hypothetical protein
MSINATSSYMSNADILAWMETKTEGLYGHMRDAMDVANTRSDAESALDDVKAELQNAKNNGGDATAVTQAINDALAKYKDVPEVAEVLQPMADKLNGEYAKAAKDAATAQATAAALSNTPNPGGAAGMVLQAEIDQANRDSKPRAIKLDSNDVDNWAKQIGDKVDALGKQDQLGLIQIQEFNSQLNQAKQTASALMDAADKSSSNIINHIS